MIFNDIYEQALYNAAKNQAEEITIPYNVDDLNEEQLQKITNHAVRIGVDYETLLNDVLNNKSLFLTVVGKSPSRMNLYEKTFMDYVKNNYIDKGDSPIVSIKQLPASGLDAKYVFEGKVYSGKEIVEKVGEIKYNEHKNAKNLTKSLDFEIKVRLSDGRIVDGYITAKYTKIDGGSQDNQRNDVLKTLKSVSSDAGVLVIANVDGDYYVKQRNGKSTYFDEMTENFKDNPYVYVTTYKNIADVLSKVNI